MKFYLIKKDQGNSKFCYPVIEENSPWCDENLYANEYNNLHELPIHYIVDNNYEPDDFLIASNNIISKRFMKIIKELNINVTFFESQMYLNNERIWDLFYTVILPHYNLLNREKSIYMDCESSVTGKHYISKIKKLIFDIEKVKKIRDDTFFTMEEKPTRCYCNEIGKRAIEEAGLKGIDFEEVPVE